MGMTWNVTDENGASIVDLDGIADALGMDRKGAAAYLAGASFLDAAPDALRAEVKAATTTLAVGEFVTVEGKTGRIDLIIKDGEVPGVDADVKGHPDAHAARVALWDVDADGRPHATGQKVAAPLDDLEPADAPTVQVVDAGIGDALNEILTRNYAEATAGRMPTEAAVKSAYDRGLASWPGDQRTSLSAHQWGLGRAEFLVKAAIGATEVPGNDVDLLPEDHPTRLEFATDAAVIAVVEDTPAATDEAPAAEETPATEEQVVLSAEDIKSLESRWDD